MPAGYRNTRGENAGCDVWEKMGVVRERQKDEKHTPLLLRCVAHGIREGLVEAREQEVGAVRREERGETGAATRGRGRRMARRRAVAPPWRGRSSSGARRVVRRGDLDDGNARQLFDRLEQRLLRTTHL